MFAATTSVDTARITGLVLAGVVAALHGYFLVMEMFLWRTARVRASFGMTEEYAEQTATLAKNQGLYNGFLSAGLIWGLVVAGTSGADIRTFFLACVVAAGLYGGVTVSRRIVFIQALPAAVALVVTVISR